MAIDRSKLEASKASLLQDNFGDLLLVVLIDNKNKVVLVENEDGAQGLISFKHLQEIIADTTVEEKTFKGKTYVLHTTGQFVKVGTRGFLRGRKENQERISLEDYNK